MPHEKLRGVVSTAEKMVEYLSWVGGVSSRPELFQASDPLPSTDFQPTSPATFIASLQQLQAVVGEGPLTIQQPCHQKIKRLALFLISPEHSIYSKCHLSRRSVEHFLYVSMRRVTKSASEKGGGDRGL